MSATDSGLTVENAKSLSDTLFSQGCITGEALPAEEDAISTNAVFDAAARFSRFVRIVNRLQIVGYAVIEGKSVLWFKRDQVNTGANLFDGIADSIVTEATKNQWTNEWLMSVHLKAYAPSDTNVFAVSALADYYALWNRCLWFDGDIGSDPDWLWHVSYGAEYSGYNVIAEAPSGWNYGRLIGTSAYLNQPPEATDPDKHFYKSCRIYEPDYEVEDAETIDEDGETLVKITFNTRFRNTNGEVDGAPDSIARDMTGWVAADIAAEPFRADENGIRLYLLHNESGYNPVHTVGDQSLHSDVHTTVSGVYAAIYPHFLFVRLVPTPYVDDNATQNPVDTPMWHDVTAQMEVYLRAMCEGYVDEASTALLNNCIPDPGTGECTDSGHDLYDYMFGNLCYHSFGGRWITTLPTIATSKIDAEDVRDDKPEGFGPLPNTVLSSEVFNELAAAVDELTRVRVMLPYTIESRTIEYTGQRVVTAAEATDCGGALSCGATGHVVWRGVGAVATTYFNDTGWVTYATPLAPRTSCSFPVSGCSGGDYTLDTVRDILYMRLQLVDADAVNAIPEDWRDMLTTGIGTMFCRNRFSWRYHLVDGVSTDECDPLVDFGCRLEKQTLFDATDCVFIKGDEEIRYDYGPQAPDSWYGTKWSALGTCGPLGSITGMYLTPQTERCMYLEIPLEEPGETAD